MMLKPRITSSPAALATLSTSSLNKDRGSWGKRLNRATHLVHLIILIILIKAFPVTIHIGHKYTHALPTWGGSVGISFLQMSLSPDSPSCSFQVLEILAKPLAPVYESGYLFYHAKCNHALWSMFGPLGCSPFTTLLQSHPGLGCSAMTTHIQVMLVYHTEPLKTAQIF